MKKLALLLLISSFVTSANEIAYYSDVAKDLTISSDYETAIKFNEPIESYGCSNTKIISVRDYAEIGDELGQEQDGLTPEEKHERERELRSSIIVTPRGKGESGCTFKLIDGRTYVKLNFILTPEVNTPFIVLQPASIKTEKKEKKQKSQGRALAFEILADLVTFSRPDYMEDVTRRKEIKTTRAKYKIEFIGDVRPFRAWRISVESLVDNNKLPYLVWDDVYQAPYEALLNPEMKTKAERVSVANLNKGQKGYLFILTPSRFPVETLLKRLK